MFTSVCSVLVDERQGDEEDMDCDEPGQYLLEYLYTINPPSTILVSSLDSVAHNTALHCTALHLS